MINTRKGGGIDLPANNRRRRIVNQPQPEMNPPSNPPPAGVDPPAQMQLLQQMANTIMAEMRQERQEMRQEWQEIRQELRQERLERQQQPPLPPPPPPAPLRDKHREFMSHKPPTFSNSPDPLQADDWLKTVDKMLNIAQCTDREKVLYASGRLTGLAADWWDSYCAAHAAANTITWAEFSTQFRNYHIPASLMKIKKKEFLSLKQGNMTVSEYHDKFIQLSRYAPDEVADDERKQEQFMEGLIGPLQYQLVSHTFSSFQRLLDKAIAVEHKRVQLGEMKRKTITQGQGSSSVRRRYVPPQGTPARPGGGQQSYQRPAQQTPQATPQTPHTRQDAPTVTPARPTGQGTATDTICFKCGEIGHYANVCPKRNPNTPARGNSQVKQTQTLGSNRGYSIAKVNQINVEATEDGPNIVIGTFFINSMLATILFYSGASHSFISARYVLANSLPYLALHRPMIVITPKGAYEATYMSHRIELTILGRKFWAMPVVLEESIIDLILGMNWLKQWNAVIHCARGTVELSSPDGDRFEVTVAPPTSNHGLWVKMCNLCRV
jgi:hypothetical protein